MASSLSTIINNKMSESFTLIWLNASVNDVINVKIQQCFLLFIEYLKTFVNIKDCEQYLQSSSIQDAFILIVSGQMGKEIVPRIHELRQIRSIYIYCIDKKTHEQWSKEYTKVKGVIVQMPELINIIRLEQERSNQNTVNELISISIFKKNIPQEEILNGFNSQFLYMKCLIDFLLRLKPSEQITDEFISLCQEEYENNEIVLNNIKEFEKDYSSNSALSWSTKTKFLFKILNKALYNQKLDLLYLSRFFLHDFQEQIKQNQCLTSIQFYRSQFLSNTQLENLQNAIGNYILISTFFSANIHRDKALSNFDHETNPENLKQILFEINANPISPFCYSSNQQEIIFSLGSIFHLLDIQLNENQIWIIRMTLCHDNDLNFKSLIDQMKANDNYWTTDLLLFGTILQEKKKYIEAEKFHRLLLNELAHDHPDIDACYYSLGTIADEKGNYDLSLKYYQLSLEILLRKNQSKHSHLGRIYNMIGEIYRKKGQLKEALESYNQALNVWKDNFEINQMKKCQCLSNIAFIYRYEKKYLEAISYYTEALYINEKYLSINHSDLGILNHNIGALNWCLGHYDDAVKYYNVALDIKCKSLSSQHPSVAMTLENLGLLNENNEDFQQALSYYEQAAKIYRQILPQAHPDVMQIDQAIRRVSSKL